MTHNAPRVVFVAVMKGFFSFKKTPKINEQQTKLKAIA